MLPSTRRSWTPLIKLSAPGGKTPEKESVLKKLHEAKATAAPKKPEQQKSTPEL